MEPQQLLTLLLRVAVAASLASLLSRTVTGDVSHFSGYAVAW